MNALPEPLASFDVEILVASFSTQGELVVSNEAWQHVLGAQQAPWVRLLEEDRARVGHNIEDAANGLLVTNEVVQVGVPERDEPLPVLLNFLPVHSKQEDGAVGVLALTITGEVLAEPVSWTISHTQRHRLEALGRMTMGIAHDFNNLLSGILGYTELLTSTADAERLPPSFLDHLATIEQAALDGAALVKKIQQYLRHEKETRFEPVDLPSLMQDCVSLTRPYWYNEPRRQGIEINLELALREVPAVMGSASELREVFVNLILNAVQAMPEGGRLTLLSGYEEAQGVQVEVVDTGVGMSETVRQRIFEPLFTTKGERGSGMGLAVTYGIIQEHDGTIYVESKLGAGTRFLFTFPPAKEVIPIEEPKTAPLSTRKAHIMIVDDEQMVRSVLSKLLTLRGHAVSVAASGPRALRLTRDHPFDIAILDQAMPEMSGRELAQELRRRFPKLPIILLTGDTDIGTKDANIDVILSKPFQIDEVEATIQGLIDPAP